MSKPKLQTHREEYPRYPETKTYPEKTKRGKPYRVMGKWYYPLEDSEGFRQQGIASWYGKDFHGKFTSNGEVYDMNKVSAAHKILPLGTYVRVKNLTNGRVITVRINDRGPFVSGRIIDLSRAAAMRLGVYGPGTAPVEIVALGRAVETKKKSKVQKTFVPVQYEKGIFRIQVGAFGDRENAERLKDQLSRNYAPVIVQKFHSHSNYRSLHRVLVGKCYTLSRAEEYESILKRNGFQEAFIIAE